MGGLAGIASVFARTPGLGLPPLPGDLGLPPVPVKVGQGFNQGKNPKDEDPKAISKQIADADNYNKAFADLLNKQPQLNGSERSQLYSAYSVGSKDTHKGAKPTDYSGTLSQFTPEQYQAEQAKQQQQQQQAATPQPEAAIAPVQAAPAAAPAAAPQTVGPVPTPQVTAPQPEATPTTATPGGNIAGKTTTTGGVENSASKTSAGRRGRMATLLTGLGGAVERFGL